MIGNSINTGGNALAAATEMTYDADLNVTITKQYDYVSISQTTGQTADIPSISNGTLLRTSETDYLTNNPSYRAWNLLALPTANRIKNGRGTIVAQSSISYDEAGYPLTSMRGIHLDRSGHHCARQSHHKTLSINLRMNSSCW